MIITTPYFSISVVTNPEVAGHLIPNIKNFEIVYYLKQELKGGKPNEPEEKDIVKVQMLCSQGKVSEIMNYIEEYYVKRYGVICYYEKVSSV